jgi:uncharacterized protein YpmB
MTKDANIENCSKIFVSWSWAVIFIAGFIVIIAGISWTTATAYSDVKNQQTNQQTEINKLKTTAADIDTVKTLLREMKKDARSNSD